MLASASPRKPLVVMALRSSAWRILLVACRSKLMRASVALMPLPSSVTCIKVRPASFTTSVIWVAPASTLFSNSSFTTLAGRWTTSPAAIWLATWSGNRRMMSDMSVRRSVAVACGQCTNKRTLGLASELFGNAAPPPPTDFTNKRSIQGLKARPYPLPVASPRARAP